MKISRENVVLSVKNVSLLHIGFISEKLWFYNDVFFSGRTFKFIFQVVCASCKKVAQLGMVGN